MSSRITAMLLATFAFGSALNAGAVVCPDAQHIMDRMNTVKVGGDTFTSNKQKTDITFSKASSITPVEGGTAFKCEYSDGLSYTAHINGTCHYTDETLAKKLLLPGAVNGKETYTCEGTENCADITCTEEAINLKRK